MKLKSILIMTMVAIMAVAGGALAATTTTNSTNTIDGTGFAGGITYNLGGGVCSSVANTTVTCGAVLTNAQSAAFVTDAQTGSGTGLAGGMPAQVSYSANAFGVGLGGYLSGVGPQTGYQLTQTLFSMCAFSGGALGNCPKFVPTAALAGANTIGGLLIASGGGNAADGGAGTIASSTIPTGTAVFNQGTFVTGLVSNGGNTVGTFVNGLSQSTFHHSVANAGGGNGDYIDQRLAQVIGTNQTLAQSTQIGGTITAAPITGVAVDPSFRGNIDPYIALAGALGVNTNPTQAQLTAALATSLTPSAALNTILTNAQAVAAGGPSGAFQGDGGAITQAVADNNSGGFGDYGQIFTNDTVISTNGITPPAAPAAAATAYAATGTLSGVLSGSITTIP